MRFLVLGIAMLAVIGCGKKDTPAVNTAGACSKSTLLGSYSGYYNGDTSGRLVLNGDCTGTLEQCGASFTYSPTTGTSGTFNFKTTSSSATAVNCPAANSNVSWTFSINDNQVAFGLPAAGGGGSASFEKQQ